MQATIHFNRLLANKAAKHNTIIRLKDVSSETGVSEKALGNWSNGGLSQIHLGVAYQLCRYFECDLGELVSFNGDE